MTKTEKFLKKFPDHELMTNCLVDIACPKCGSREGINVQAVIRCEVHLYDNGTDGNGGDTEYDDNSACRCSVCGHAAKLRNFTFPGLDEALPNITR